ncbi:MAG: SLBB domain-containing protein, partial [Bacteroidales bacterium]|nr:SLBB domain-containing protein [Bacteroidales bacterium]
NFAPSENLATPKNYRLGPGDEVIIDIFGANQATLRSKISPEGSINVDVLGPLYLSGMTIDEANKYLKRKLASIYGGLNRSSTGTDIRLSLGQIRSIQVNVLGDVENPGTYTTSAFATVFHVLYLAGGVSGPGTLRDIIVNRDGEVIAKVDVYDFLMNGSRSSDIRLEEGDVVMVHPYSILVMVGGEVKRQMSFELKEGETLADVLRYAGGFSTGAFSDNVGVVRQNGKSFEVRTVDAENYGSFRMEDGDEVTVSKLNSFYENRIAVTGAVYQPGTYELNSEVKTVKGLVQKAGGLLPEAFTNRAVLHREHEDKTLEVISLNLGRVMSGADPDIRLQKNDELFITRSSDIRQLGTMSVSGMVINPGTFPFASNTTVEDIIIMAGGLQEGASTARVDISRRKRDSNGLVVLDEVGELISVPLSSDFTDGDGPKTYLEPYDEVIVHQSPSYNVQTHVTLTGEANFAGPFTLTTRNERISDLVKKAGGVTPYAYLEGARLYRNMG